MEKNNQIVTMLELARTLPTGPGCYLFKKDGEILYVGKAKNLRRRASSYFQKTTAEMKTQALVRQVNHIDFLPTANEIEALILENTLIKKHLPKYNIRLRDDRAYPHVEVNRREAFPRPLVSYRVQKTPGREIYGPFVSGSNIREVVRVLTKMFALRDCSLAEFSHRKSPCLLHQMGQCCAPCVGKITISDYQHRLQLALSVLTGQENQAFAQLQEQMMAAAGQENFELAAIYRDGIQVLTAFTKQQREEQLPLPDTWQNFDLISYHQSAGELDLLVTQIRAGRAGLRRHYFWPVCGDWQEELVETLFQHFGGRENPFPVVLPSSYEKAHRQLLAQALELVEGRKWTIVGICAPLVPFGRSVLQELQDRQRQRQQKTEHLRTGLMELQRLLGLVARPRILECYDIAVWQGASPTAAKVVFVEGLPYKAYYRHYTLATRPEGNNDFAMLQEVFARRLLQGDYPDVLVIDGGAPQLQAVEKVLKATGVQIPLIGIAKENRARKKVERLVMPGQGETVSLAQYRGLFQLLTQMRNEAHRFARKLHHRHELRRILPNS